MLVVNIWPEGTEDGTALVRNLRYGFQLVHAPENWKQSMGKIGKGANFLLDQRGRVIARPHFYTPSDFAVADRLVKGLLRYGEKASAHGRKE